MELLLPALPCRDLGIRPTSQSDRKLGVALFVEAIKAQSDQNIVADEGRFQFIEEPSTPIEHARDLFLLVSPILVL